MKMGKWFRIRYEFSIQLQQIFQNDDIHLLLDMYGYCDDLSQVHDFKDNPLVCDNMC